MEKKFLSLKISQLALDPLNPRFEQELSGELAALAEFIRDERLSKKLLRLIKHIAEHGMDPLSRLMVHPVDGKKFQADEGNRRTSALKLLNDPSQAQAIDVAFYRKLKRIVDNAKHIPEKVDCVLIQDDVERGVWLKVRHLGENEGVGTSPWGATENTRYAKRNGGNNRMEFSLNVIETLLARGNLDNLEKEILRDVPLTTLERMLGDPQVREALGVGRDGNKILLLVKGEKEVLKALKHLVIDIYDGEITARKINDRKQRADILESWPKGRKPGLHLEPIEPREIRADILHAELEVPNSIDSGEGVPGGNSQPDAPHHRGTVPDTTEEPGTTSPNGVLPRTSPNSEENRDFTAPPARSAPSPDQRKKLIPINLRLHIPDKKVNRIYIELKKLDVENFENAISVLLRVFLELSVDAFLAGAGLTPHENTKLKIKMGLVADEWERTNMSTANALKPWRNAASSNVLFSLNTLHSYVHSPHGIPNRRELLQTWDKMEHYFKLLWP